MGILLAICLILYSGSEQGEGAAGISSVSGTGSVSEERKVKYLLQELNGVEDVSVMLKTDEEENVVGAVVICPRGEDPTVQEKIIRLLRALYGIGAHQIGVSG